MYLNQLRAREQTQSQQVIEGLAAAILRYMETRRTACDNLDGILQWWIPAQGHAHSRSDVLCALQVLESRGQIDRRTGADGLILYGAHFAQRS
jgi:hypothetical protein